MIARNLGTICSINNPPGSFCPSTRTTNLFGPLFNDFLEQLLHVRIVSILRGGLLLHLSKLGLVLVLLLEEVDLIATLLPRESRFISISSHTTGTVQAQAWLKQPHGSKGVETAAAGAHITDDAFGLEAPLPVVLGHLDLAHSLPSGRQATPANGGTDALIQACCAA